jgi:hypothetical protein
MNVGEVRILVDGKSCLFVVAGKALDERMFPFGCDCPPMWLCDSIASVRTVTETKTLAGSKTFQVNWHIKSSVLHVTFFGTVLVRDHISKNISYEAVC